MTRVQNPSDMQDALKDALKTNWKLFLFQGVVMVILGILAVAWPAVATIAVDLYVGWEAWKILSSPPYCLHESRLHRQSV